jgi:o-succinylbenzoate synthase
VKIVAVRWTPYAIPFRRPIVTSHRRWDGREGVILEIETHGGRRGLGDVAPLPEFGTADAAACAAALAALAHKLVGKAVSDATSAFDAAVPDAVFAPLRCAIETACLDIEGQASGMSIARLLVTDAPATVAVNAIVSDEHASTRAVAEGFRAIKLKIGAASQADDVARVAAVRRAIGPGVTLRLDANGAWREHEAIAFIRAAAPSEIEFVEQPIASGDLAAMRRVRAAVSVPIAADEDVTSVDAARRIVTAGAADVLIVKPAVVGGLRRACEIAAIAAAAGAEAVVTSAMESGVGVAGALQAAAALGGGGSHRHAAGLATLDLLVSDLLIERLPVVAGAMAVPPGPGLGVALDAAEAERWQAGPAGEVRA